MNFASGLGGFIFGFQLFKQPAEEKKVAALTPDEKECYNKIVKELLAHSMRFPEQNEIDADLKINHAYAIIFRQSEGWVKIENQLNEIKREAITTTQLSPQSAIATSRWAKDWLERITQVREANLGYHQSNSKLREFEEQRKTGKQFTRDQLSEIHYLIKKREEEKKIISKFPTKGQEQLLKDKDNAILNEYSKTTQLISFMLDNWLKLSVFSDWQEVSMDKQGLSVQIRRPKEKVKMEGFLNKATKAIFLINEVELKEKPIDKEDMTLGKIIQPTAMAIQERCFTEATPPPKRRNPIDMTEELFFDFDLPDPVKPPKEQEAWQKKMEKKLTSQAEKLENIVKLALQEVNKSLAQDLS